MGFVVKLFTDPLVFNYLIITLYATNAVQLIARAHYVDGLYWVGAFWITAVVTFGYPR